MQLYNREIYLEEEEHRTERTTPRLIEENSKYKDQEEKREQFSKNAASYTSQWASDGVVTA